MGKIQINFSSSKKRKRGERVLRFESFCQPGFPTHFDGSFQENMRALLGYGHRENIVQEGFECWSFLLELHHKPPLDLKLFIVEELVGNSLHQHCHYCRSIGWGKHMICCKRFHILLPSKESTPDHQLEETKLIIEVDGVDSEKHAMQSKLAMDVENHLMHGFLHLNGFGHLICIKGYEGGSEFLSGHQIMDFWDRICTALQVRQVSLIDVAKKEKMELRLIHGLAYGVPWFEQWGYKFGHGSYDITKQLHQRALQVLRGFPLSLISPLSYTIYNTDISTIAARYQVMSPQAPITLGDLFRCMMELKRRLPRENTATTLDFHSVVTAASCRWSIKRVEMAAHVIVQVLKGFGLRWVTRQEVRDASRVFIGDTGLLDFVLKSLGNHLVGKYIVRRMVNPVCKVLEYCLQEILTPIPFKLDASSLSKQQFSRLQIKKDMLYLYKHVLIRDQFQPMHAAIPVAVNILLDTKHLIKEYLTNPPPHSEISCIVRTQDQHPHERSELLPTEIMKIPTNSTVGDLKRGVERYYRSTYCGLKGFVAEQVVIEHNEMGGREDCELFVGGGKVIVEGRKDDQEILFEDGRGEEVVDCVCGAKEEDGERMVRCDVCEVLQHTRCVRIPDEEEVPGVFLCGRCERDIVALPLMPY